MSFSKLLNATTQRVLDDTLSTLASRFPPPLQVTVLFIKPRWSTASLTHAGLRSVVLVLLIEGCDLRDVNWNRNIQKMPRVRHRHAESMRFVPVRAGLALDQCFETQRTPAQTRPGRQYHPRANNTRIHLRTRQVTAGHVGIMDHGSLWTCELTVSYQLQ